MRPSNASLVARRLERANVAAAVPNVPTAQLFGVVFMPAPYIDVSPVATIRPPSGAATQPVALPAPPAGNVDAETLWYQETLERFEQQQTPATPNYVMTLPVLGQLPFDIGLGVSAVLVWLFASAVAAVTLRRTSSARDPIIVRREG